MEPIAGPSSDKVSIPVYIVPTGNVVMHIPHNRFRHFFYEYVFSSLQNILLYASGTWKSVPFTEIPLIMDFLKESATSPNSELQDLIDKLGPIDLILNYLNLDEGYIIVLHKQFTNPELNIMIVSKNFISKYWDRLTLWSKCPETFKLDLWFAMMQQNKLKK